MSDESKSFFAEEKYARVQNGPWSAVAYILTLTVNSKETCRKCFVFRTSNNEEFPRVDSERRSVGGDGVEARQAGAVDGRESD